MLNRIVLKRLCSTSIPASQVVTKVANQSQKASGQPENVIQLFYRLTRNKRIPTFVFDSRFNNETKLRWIQTALNFIIKSPEPAPDALASIVKLSYLLTSRRSYLYDFVPHLFQKILNESLKKESIEIAPMFEPGLIKKLILLSERFQITIEKSFDQFMTLYFTKILAANKFNRESNLLKKAQIVEECSNQQTKTQMKPIVLSQRITQKIDDAQLPVLDQIDQLAAIQFILKRQYYKDDILGHALQLLSKPIDLSLPADALLYRLTTSVNLIYRLQNLQAHHPNYQLLTSREADLTSCKSRLIDSYCDLITDRSRTLQLLASMDPLETRFLFQFPKGTDLQKVKKAFTKMLVSILDPRQLGKHSAGLQRFEIVFEVALCLYDWQDWRDVYAILQAFQRNLVAFPRPIPVRPANLALLSFQLCEKFKYKSNFLAYTFYETLLELNRERIRTIGVPLKFEGLLNSLDFCRNINLFLSLLETDYAQPDQTPHKQLFSEMKTIDELSDPLAIRIKTAKDLLTIHLEKITEVLSYQDFMTQIFQSFQFLYMEMSRFRKSKGTGVDISQQQQFKYQLKTRRLQLNQALQKAQVKPFNSNKGQVFFQKAEGSASRQKYLYDSLSATTHLIRIFSTITKLAKMTVDRESKEQKAMLGIREFLRNTDVQKVIRNNLCFPGLLSSLLQLLSLTPRKLNTDQDNELFKDLLAAKMQFSRQLPGQSMRQPETKIQYRSSLDRLWLHFPAFMLHPSLAGSAYSMNSDNVRKCFNSEVTGLAVALKQSIRNQIKVVLQQFQKSLNQSGSSRRLKSRLGYLQYPFYADLVIKVDQQVHIILVVNPISAPLFDVQFSQTERYFKSRLYKIHKVQKASQVTAVLRSFITK